MWLILSSYSENHIHNHFGDSHAENFNLKQILAKFMLISKVYQVKSNLLKMKIFVLINTILDYKSYEFSAFLFKLKKRATLCFSCGSAASKPKLYIPSILNIDLILWHTQLIVCAVKC